MFALKPVCLTVTGDQMVCQPGFADGYKKMVVGVKSASEISPRLSLGPDDRIRNEVVEFLLRQTGGSNLFLGF